jgi:hypothetical protein
MVYSQAALTVVAGRMITSFRMINTLGKLRAFMLVDLHGTVRAFDRQHEIDVSAEIRKK